MSTQTDKENPFLGLKPYEEKDRKRLYGRDRDLLLMKDRIGSGRTTLLFAGSGVGKTSFINAKIIPELQGQYDIIYHNQWSIQDPLTALSNSLINQCPREPDAECPSLIGRSYAPLLAYLGNCIRGGANYENKVSRGRCLIILDQFEEIFQYHSHHQYFATFIDKLSELINFTECNARVLFSMREEFLGELSVFDNKIRDLFANYYRLKSPNRDEAKEIIERTCSLEHVSVDDKKLRDLVRELTWIDRDASINGDGGRPAVASFEKDIVAPPYLQIACRGLWNSQFKPVKRDQSVETKKQEDSDGTSPGLETSPQILMVEENGNATDTAPPVTPDGPPDQPTEKVTSSNESKNLFLANYKVGDARKMLQRFCEKTFASFNTRELSLLITAFDYLVTKKGAKIAYELSSLSEHMNVKEDVLKPVLLKLSNPDSRILRARGPDNALWFELYHDMYGPIVDDWRKAYRLKRQARVRYAFRTSGMLVVFFALIAGAILAYSHWWKKPQYYEQLLRQAKLEDPISYRNSQWAFNELSKTWGYEQTARRLWAEAWVNRARAAEQQEKNDEAFLSWLKAAAEGPSTPDSITLSQINSYLSVENYKHLLASFRLDPDPTSLNVPIFSADGSMLLSLTKDMRVTRWHLGRGEPVGETSNLLQVDDNPAPTPTPPGGLGNRQGSAPPRDLQPGTLIRSAAGNVIAGLTRGRFCLWDFSTGTRIWISAIDDRSQSGDNSKKGGGYNQSVPDAFQKYISVSPNGRYFATLDQHSLHAYELTDDKTAPARLVMGLDSVAQMAMSPDNHTLLLVRTDGKLTFLDLAEGSDRIHEVPGKRITQAVFSPNGSKFLTRAHDLVANEVDSEGPEIVEIRSTSSFARVSDISGLASNTPVSFCNDNTTVAIIDSDFSEERKTILRITLANSDTNDILDTRVTSFVTQTNNIFNPNGTSLLLFADDGIARLWDLNPSSSDRKIVTDSAVRKSFAVDVNAQTIATINTDKVAKYWDGDDGKQIGEQKLLKKIELAQNPTAGIVPNRDLYIYNQVGLSRNGRYSAIKEPNGRFTIWDVKNNHEVLLDRSDKAIEKLIAFSADDKMVAILDSANKLSLWRDLNAPRSGEVFAKAEEVRSLVFSRDGKYLAVVHGYDFFTAALTAGDFEDNSSTRGIRFFDVPTFNEMKRIDDRLVDNTLRFIADGKVIGRVVKQNLVIVFNVATGTRLSLPHSYPITAMANTRNGMRLLTSTTDGTLWLWDTNDGHLIAQQKYDFRVRDLRISYDGETALAFSSHWVHAFNIKNDVLKYQDGQLIESYSNARLKDETGKTVRIIFELSDKALEIKDLTVVPDGNVKSPAPTVREMASWPKKLSLAFDDNGQLRPDDGVLKP